LIYEFWAFWCMCLCTWPTNFIWDEFWVWEDQNWSVGEKGFWNSKFFFSELLRVRLSEPQANVPSSFWTQLAWANRKRSVSEQQSCFYQEFAWAKRKQTPSERTQNATETWSLKRTSRRLSEPCPVQPYLIFRFVYLRTNLNFLNGFFWFI